ncbi:hypothetical protein [Kitasatospora sp. NPDC086791]|uniref:hypothetical protein n=1 Tax=Kitasatospora sp. NPDC086791 TaxID=3155178 RepID=UPI00341C6A26
MRARLRPGTHFLPTTKGLRCLRGEHSVLLAGPPALHRLVDGLLAELCDGADTDTLVARLGDESARPVLDRLLHALVEHGLMFDLDAGGPVPDPATAARFEDVLAHLEEHCADPYAAFARLRRAGVRVLGDTPEGAPAVASAVRSLAAHAIGAGEPGADAIGTDEPGTDEPGTDEPEPLPDAAIAVVRDPADLPAQLAALPPGTPYVPVLTAPGRILVGPVLPAGERAERFEHAVARADAWRELDPLGPPPARLGAALAGALAARRLLDLLAGTGRDDGALLLVHGRTAETTRIDLAPAPAQAATEVDLTIHQLLDVETHPDPTAESLAVAAERLTTPWTGLARGPEPGDTPVLPFHLAAFHPLAPPAAGPLTGWGTDPAEARTDGLLRVLRHTVAADPLAARPPAADPPAAPWSPGAGTGAHRWLLDGLLRLIGRELTLAHAGSALSWEQLPPAARGRWRALDDWYDRPSVLLGHTAPGLDWCVVSVRAADGEVLAAEWGPSPATAAHHALGEALAGLQRGAKPGPPGAAFPVTGTRALEHTAADRLGGLFDRLTGSSPLAGRTVAARRLSADPAAGPLPDALACGRVWLAEPPRRTP